MIQLKVYFKNKDDNILLFYIDPAMNNIIRNNKDEVYCRQGDSSIKLTSDQLEAWNMIEKNVILKLNY